MKTFAFDTGIHYGRLYVRAKDREAAIAAFCDMLKVTVKDRSEHSYVLPPNGERVNQLTVEFTGLFYSYNVYEWTHGL